jgi:hypothetical protein
VPRTKTTTVYIFDELDERAKERAREWMRTIEASDCDFDHVLDDAAIICGLLGIRLTTRTVHVTGGRTRREPIIYYSGFYTQGDGACFEGSYGYAPGASAKIRAHAPHDTALHQIADRLRTIQRRRFYHLEASLSHRGRYYHEHSVTIDVGDNRNIYRDIGKDADALADALRDLMSWIYRQLEAEYAYRLADEQIDEVIRANEYEFTADGVRT